jgi:hypothetical protein
LAKSQYASRPPGCVKLISVEKRHEIARPSLFALLIAAPANAAAKLDTVQDLMQMCRSDNTIAEATDKAICLGWIGGATDVMFARDAVGCLRIR